MHAVLVVGALQGRPLGWVTARGLLAFLAREDSMISVRDAITHPPVSIDQSATIREVIRALEQPGVSQLIVSRAHGGFPEGVVSDFDVVALAAR